MGLGGKRDSCYDLATSAESPKGTALGAQEPNKKVRSSSVDEKEEGEYFYQCIYMCVHVCLYNLFH